nr:immunoglobulin heavy chain junction region [Mus musculus]
CARTLYSACFAYW